MIPEWSDLLFLGVFICFEAKAGIAFKLAAYFTLSPSFPYSRERYRTGPAFYFFGD